MNLNSILKHNVMDPWPIEDSSVHSVITSPPYWALRDYGVEGQLGMEDTPEEYIEKMVGVFREAKRVLREDGTLWVNIGDTYFGGKGANGATDWYQRHSNAINKMALLTTQPGEFRPNDRPHPFLKPKDLVGIPWMLAFALRADGWYLRQDIIWHKPNPMPESIADRCTKSHEYFFLLSKSRKYLFDAEAIKTPSFDPTDDLRRLKNGRSRHPLVNGIAKSGNKERKPGTARGCPEDSGSNVCGSVPWEGNMANKRSVWTVPTIPFKEAHFATFPPALIIDCIKAGCPAGGTVLDPFMGAGTTALVAAKLGRNFLGLELNPEYIAIAEERLRKELGLFYQQPLNGSL